MKLLVLHPKHYYIEFLKFIKYILKPTLVDSNTNSVLQNMKGTWSMFVLKTILYIILGVLITTLINPVNQTTARWTEIYSTSTIFLLSIIILPLLEEVAFRLSLRFKTVYITLTFGVFMYYVFSKLIYQTQLSNIDNHFGTRIIISILAILVAYVIVSQPKIKKQLNIFWKTRFTWIFYFFCITFAWIHIFNYEINLKHLLLLPLITLPKLVSAMTYGYIRMHYGFKYSLGLHMCWNSIGFIMSLFPVIAGD
ncbi:hypothetical protein [Kordia sp.]|uniref:hypothetical protein n=1 Tax=Kordia sp. TaxID=1965332 RepID=UPI003D2BA3A1